jgi:hypothetical protein
VETKEVGKAETLGNMLSAFAPEFLNESKLPSFYYDKTMAIRTGDEWSSPLRDLFKRCTTPSSGNAHLLLGHGGCGKSTELRQLKRQFEVAGHPVELIDAETEMDMFHIDQWDIMLHITEGLCAIADKNNITIPNDTLNAVYDYLTKDIEQSEENTRDSTTNRQVGIEARTPSIINIIKVFASVKNELKANTVTRTKITEKMNRRAADWIKYINEISTYVISGLNGKQPILIFENIDKITYPEKPEKVLDIFKYQILARMPFPIIYTFPIDLCYADEFAAINSFYTPHILPMIKVSNIDKKENIEGINVIREIVKLRANENLFDKDVLNTLIKQTGGSLRDLFKCIMVAAARAEWRGATKIEMEDAKRSLTERRGELTKTISTADYPQLINIYRSAKFREQIEDRTFLLKKMHALIVLEYNGNRWHDLHPLVAEFLKEQGIINDPDR